jgi:hypothetical protein
MTDRQICKGKHRSGEAITLSVIDQPCACKHLPTLLGRSSWLVRTVQWEINPPVGKPLVNII